MDIYAEFIQLARLAMSGRKDDVVMLLRRALRRSGSPFDRPEFQQKLRELLRQSEEGGEFQRRISMAPAQGRPSASDFVYTRKPDFRLEPVWPESVSTALKAVVSEREKLARLKAANVEPTRSMLFVGPPGVGKTLAAEWLANALARDLMVLDLASVMSSYLGRTGANLSSVIEEAATTNAVLLLDEFDSIGKRRGDQGDIGELKRLANVLLQSLDRWSGEGLLVAATNHPDLLDPAVWRRFDRVVSFPMPNKSELKTFSSAFLRSSGFDVSDELLDLFAIALEGSSFADAKLWLSRCVRATIIAEGDIATTLAAEAREVVSKKSAPERARAATILIGEGMSQRDASEMIGISRDTIRKYHPNPAKEEN